MVPQMAGKYPPSLIGLERIVEQKLPPARKIDAHLAPKTKLIGRISSNDVFHRKIFRRALHRLDSQAIASVFGFQAIDFRLDLFELLLGPRIGRGEFLAGGGILGRIDAVVQARLNLRQMCLFHFPPHGAVFRFIERDAFSPASAHFGVQILKSPPGFFRRRGDNFAVDQQRFDAAVKPADLQAFDRERPFGPSFFDDAKIVDPLKRSMSQLEISYAHQPPCREAAIVVDFLSSLFGNCRRERVEGPRFRLVAPRSRDLAHDDCMVGQRQFNDRPRPKRADALIHDERHQSHDQHQRNRQRSAGQP